MGGVGIFLVVSAAIVLFPVLLQVKLGEIRLRESWGYFVLALGLLIAALADTRIGAAQRPLLAVVGLIVALGGLILQMTLKKPAKPD